MALNLSGLLRDNEKRHKSIPKQFLNVAEGLKLRLKKDYENRKSNRLTTFDKLRTLPVAESPLPPLPAVSDAKLKFEFRKQQLEKWKAEKKEKKELAAAQKKKPFVAGVVRAPLKFELLPPLKPSTSGRVTRSQTRNTMTVAKNKSPKRAVQSFAPINATFKAPQIKKVDKLPTLAPLTKRKTKCMPTFEPVIPGIANSSARPTRNKTQTSRTEVKVTRKPLETRSARGKASEPKTSRFTKQSSSSGSEVEAKSTKRIKSPYKHQATKSVTTTSRFTIQSSSSGSEVEESTKRIKTPYKPTKPAQINKLLNFGSSSTSSDTDVSVNKDVRKSKYSIVSVNSSSGSEKVFSETDSSSVKDSTVVTVIKGKQRKSMPNTPILDSGSDSRSSDVEYVSEQQLRKSMPVTPALMTYLMPKSESKSEEKLRSPKSPIEQVLSPQQMQEAKISPCVTLSRGKEKARKEMKWKMQEGLLDDDASDIESVDHFRKQLASEISRMTAMCLTWEVISEKTVLPEAVQEAVLSAVGQARLLMSQKLVQFASLVERCAKPEPGHALVTPADLHGFWDMVFMQVENVDLKFKRLEELRARDWSESEDETTTTTTATAKQGQGQGQGQVQRRGVKPKPKTAASASLKEMIAAKRRAKKQQESEPSADSTEARSFEGGFFKILSPVRSNSRVTPTTPKNRTSLLKAVLSSEAKKSASKRSTPFAMLRASILGRSVEDGLAPLELTPQSKPINWDATPGRSILKSSNAKSHKKSIKVLFTESDHEANDSTSCPNSQLEQSMSLEGLEELHTDSALSSMDLENKENKTGSRKKNQRSGKALVRQDAVEGVMTRSQMRKSINTPNDESKRKKAEETPSRTPSRTPRQSRKKKGDKKSDSEQRLATVLQEVESNCEEKTPKRSSRRRTQLFTT